MRFNNDSYYLKSYDEMEALFGDCPEALSNTNKIADRCNVKMEFGHLLLPEFPVPGGFGAVGYATSSLSGILSIIAAAMIFRSVRDAAVPQAVLWPICCG